MVVCYFYQQKLRNLKKKTENQRKFKNIDKNLKKSKSINNKNNIKI